MRNLKHPHQAGFTLLEVLVALVVLSLGMLGLAGLQAAGLRNNQSSYYRSVATEQAYDMADRMRANLAGVLGDSYDALTTTDPGLPGACTSAGTPPTFTSACSPADMAQFDHSQWLTANAALMPGGSGTVTGTPATGFAITVTWQDQLGTNTFTTRFTP